MTELSPEMSPHELESLDWYASKAVTLHQKTNRFYKIFLIIEKFYYKASAKNSDYANKVYLTLASTPSDILPLSSEGQELFASSRRIFNNYRQRNFQELKYLIEFKWHSTSRSDRKNICLSMFTVLKAVNIILNWRKEFLDKKDTPNNVISNVILSNSEIEELNKNFNKEVNQAQEILNLILFNATDIRKTMISLYKDTRQESEKAHQNQIESKKLLDETREVVLEKTFKEEALKFNETANRHKWRALISLGAAIFLGGFALCWGIYFSAGSSASQCVTGNFLQSLLCAFLKLDTRIFLFIAGIWGAGIIASLRSYFANLQNETSNRQRFNALQSYGILYRAAESPEDKTFIMKQAVECAYSHQPTGFVKPPKQP